MKGTKIEEQVQNFNESMRNYETKLFFSFAKQLETLYFLFHKTIETRRNSDLFRTVSHFLKLKKIRNCQPQCKPNAPIDPYSADRGSGVVFSIASGFLRQKKDLVKMKEVAVTSVWIYSLVFTITKIFLCLATFFH